MHNLYCLNEKKTESSQDLNDTLPCSRFMEQVFKSCPQYIFVMDIDSRTVIYRNRSMCSILGYQSKDLECPEAIFPNQLIHKHDLIDVDMLFAKLKSMRISESLETELRMKDSDGSWRYFVCRWLKQNSTDEIKAPQVLGVVSEITVFKEVARLKENQTQIAQRANSAKSNFIAQISHEIRNPLQGICGFIDLLLTTQMDDEQYQYAEAIKGATSLLRELVSDVLDFSKIESGKFKLDESEFELRKLVVDSVGVFGERTASKNIGFIVDIDPHLALTYMGDEVRLRQILYNFLSNAVKFTNEGHVGIAVSCAKNSLQKDQLTFKIFDTGIGIPERMQKKIFDRFQQVDSNPYKILGSGLGLSIVARLADAMNAKIEVDSKLNNGSCFKLTLNLNAVKKHNTAEPISGKVLIISSLQEMALAMKNTLDLPKCEVIVVKKGKIDRDQISHQKFSSIIICSHDRQLTNSCLELANTIECSNKIAILPQDSSYQEMLRSKSRYSIRTCLPHPINYLRLSAALKQEDLPRNESQGILKRVPQKPDSTPVLVIDDVEQNLLLVKKSIEFLGGKAVTTTKGGEAIELISQHNCKTVFLDCKMPDIDGPTVAKNIRANFPDDKIRIIGLTASALDTTRSDCLEAGMDDVWLKPLDLNLLKSIMYDDDVFAAS